MEIIGWDFKENGFRSNKEIMGKCIISNLFFGNLFYNLL